MEARDADRVPRRRRLALLLTLAAVLLSLGMTVTAHARLDDGPSGSEPEAAETVPTATPVPLPDPDLPGGSAQDPMPNPDPSEFGPAEPPAGGSEPNEPRTGEGGLEPNASEPAGEGELRHASPLDDTCSKSVPWSLQAPGAHAQGVFATRDHCKDGKTHVTGTVTDDDCLNDVAVARLIDKDEHLNPLAVNIYYYADGCDRDPVADELRGRSMPFDRSYDDSETIRICVAAAESRRKARLLTSYKHCVTPTVLD